MNVKKIASMVGMTAVLAIGLGACGSSGPVGMNDPVKLAAAMLAAGNSHSQSLGIGKEFSAVTCLPATGHNFTCTVDSASGESQETVTVSADGSSYLIQ